MAVDLHTHSSFSDGSDTPSELVAKAVEMGLTALALTDHDTVDGIEAARAAADGTTALIPGIELSVDWSGSPLHMLVYYLEPGRGPLQDRLQELKEGRHDRNERIVARLRDLGIDITLDEVRKEAGEGVAGRPHIARVLVLKSVVPHLPAAFEQYLRRGRPAYQERVRLQPEEAISLARASGALPVVAHPHTMESNAGDFSAALAELAEIGLIGIECHYAEYGPEHRDQLAAKARSLGLIPTGGSDYHGTYKPAIELGRGRGDLVVPDE
ncbi:MAG: PHP domain-containing protein, partial [Acidimicrobiia bacterium]